MTRKCLFIAHSTNIKYDDTVVMMIHNDILEAEIGNIHNMYC